MMDEEKVLQLEMLFGHKFSDINLLKEALTHSSMADNRLESNERLEFLGDAVLGLVICQTLFEMFPHYSEGDLTKIKSMIVSRKTCAKVAKELDLEGCLKVGKGMTAGIHGMSKSVIAGAIESIIGAIYMDGGIEDARRFICKVFEEFIKEADSEHHQDNYKSFLQQFVQQEYSSSPKYELLDEKGPDHNKCFEVAVVVEGTMFESAWGVNKKDAEQKAAQKALVELGALSGE